MKTPIKELVELVEIAGFVVENGSIDLSSEYAGELKKFVKLIVAECMAQIEEQHKPVLEHADMMKDTHWGGYVKCGVDNNVSIGEHFNGVKQ